MMKILEKYLLSDSITVILIFKLKNVPKCLIRFIIKNYINYTPIVKISDLLEFHTPINDQCKTEYLNINLYLNVAFIDEESRSSNDYLIASLKKEHHDLLSYICIIINLRLIQGNDYRDNDFKNFMIPVFHPNEQKKLIALENKIGIKKLKELIILEKSILKHKKSIDQTEKKIKNMLKN